MAYLQKKKTKYSTYYVIAETKRVNGKPRVVNQWYLGTVDKLKAIAQGQVAKDEPREIDCQEHGSVAALFKIAEELNIRTIINQKVRKRKQGMDIGDYILIAALNRAIAATSKLKIEEWVKSTTLSHLMKIDLGKLKSQNFWDHFDKLDKEAIDCISDEIACKAVSLEKVNLDCLVYDTTNYYNYWDATNNSNLAKTTKSKAGKNHLKHIGLALAVDRDFGIPLFHRLYPANEHDSKVFRGLLTSMYNQISHAVSDKKGVTFVFDKGNNSEEAIKLLDSSRHHFIGSRSPYHHKNLCRRPLSKYMTVRLDDNRSALALETRAEIYGEQRRVIVTYNDNNYRRQVYRLEKNIAKAKNELSLFKRKAKGADGRSTIDTINRKAEEIIARHHVTGYVKIEVKETESGFRVYAQRNFSAIEDAKTRFGKHILFTNRESMSTSEIVLYYRDRTIVEDAFRITKSNCWDPAFHWTDSKIRVHALTCVIALLLIRIAHKRISAQQFQYGAERMMELLRGIKSAMLFYPKSTKPIRKLCHLSPEQQVLATTLDVLNSI